MNPMKIKFLLLFLSLDFFSFSQELTWNTYDLDSLIYLDMPYEVYEKDSVFANGIKKYDLFTDEDLVSFRASKLDLANFKKLKLFSIKDDASLYRFYSEMSYLITEMIEYDSDIKIKTTRKVDIASYQGFQYILENKAKKEVSQSYVFYLKPSLYLFTHSDTKGLKKSNVENFFSSIQSEEKIKQFGNTNWLSGKYIAIYILVLLGISYIIRFYKKRKAPLNSD